MGVIPPTPRETTFVGELTNGPYPLGAIVAVCLTRAYRMQHTYTLDSEQPYTLHCDGFPSCTFIGAFRPMDRVTLAPARCYRGRPSSRAQYLD